MSKTLAIIDLGGQYCHLISRRLRDLGIWSDILDPTVRAKDLFRYAGIILSGGPRSVYDVDSPMVDPKILDLGVPVLGICYGHQLLAKFLGATVTPASGEYGLSKLFLAQSNSLFRGTPTQQTVWMSHSDSVTRLPQNLIRLAATERCEVAAFADFERRLYSIQFHPEVVHTEYGVNMLRNFSVGICGAETETDRNNRITQLVNAIREKVRKDSVFFLVSGGVDSTVAFTLCAKALPRERVLGMYVDTGLMRKGETEEFRSLLRTLGLSDRLIVRNESDRFLGSLEGIVDPEEKRQIIGRLFVDVQTEAMREYGINEKNWLLGQGTIYPDTIESGGSNGRAAIIKTHHNRCEEIRYLLEQGRVVEPLVEFYKDEVRVLGMELGLDAKLTHRWPFPGPGLAIRCLCSSAKESVNAVPKLPKHFSDYEAVELPIRSVGVQGDGRTYREVAALRGPLDYDTLQDLSTALCNIDAVYNRVVVHISGKVDSLRDAIIKPETLNQKRIETLREADFIARSIMEEQGLTNTVWQFPVILIPMSFRGGGTIVLRPVNSKDGMTANFAHLPVDVLKKIGDQIECLEGIDAVFLDITNKPPATIEWE
jgi:GMP synthase (glutamine-hydrolysing)